ncbi:Uncharacterised protein [Vibrio cholerae]|nr:Uncharacterised protein [Vibrio cholerae]CSI35897.1 Uncharacterised protein [Vibrio cholerae]
MLFSPLDIMCLTHLYSPDIKCPTPVWSFDVLRA